MCINTHLTAVGVMSGCTFTCTCRHACMPLQPWPPYSCPLGHRSARETF